MGASIHKDDLPIDSPQSYIGESLKAPARLYPAKLLQKLRAGPTKELGLSRSS